MNNHGITPTSIIEGAQAYGILGKPSDSFVQLLEIECAKVSGPKKLAIIILLLGQYSDVTEEIGKRVSHVVESFFTGEHSDDFHNV